MSRSDGSLAFRFIVSQICGIPSGIAVSKIPGAPLWLSLGTWALVTVLVLLKA